MTSPLIFNEIDFSAWSVDDRIELAMQLWDSVHDEIERNPELLPLTEEQKQELDRRIAAEEAGEMKTIPWEEVRAKLLSEK